MSRRFLTPINLPSGLSLPLTGSIGDLFFLTSDQTIYAYTTSGWSAQASGGGSASNVSDLLDVQLTNLSDGEVLIYSTSLDRWTNQNLASILYELGAISTDGGNSSTTEFTATIDGGGPGTEVFTAVYDGGNESSF